MFRLAACVMLLACARHACADGEPRAPYLTAGSSLVPTIDTTPAIDADGTVYVGITFATSHSSGQMIALAPTPDGSFKPKWHWDINDEIHASPMLGADGNLYFGADNGFLYVLDKSSGQPVWSFDVSSQVPGAYVLGTPTLSKDGSVVYVGVGSFYSDLGAVVALSTVTRDVVWIRPLPNAVQASPVVASNGTIYVGCVDSRLYAIDPQSSLAKVLCTLDAPIFASAAIGADGTVYVGSSRAEFVAIAPDGTLKWQRDMTISGSPVIGADGTVYLANFADARLYALNGRTGETRWSQPAGSGLGSTAVVRADNVVIFGATDPDTGSARVTAYNGADGTVQWSQPAAGALNSAVTISPAADHSIYIGSTNGYLYSYAGNQYPVSKYASWPTYQHDPAHTGHGPEPTDGGRLVNIAARSLAGPGTDLIPGFVIKGSGTKTLLVRAVGPGLQPFGISNPISDPALTVHVANAVQYSNDDWEVGNDVTQLVDVTAAVGAFPLASGSKDAATIVRLDAGSSQNTVTVESKGGQPGVALMEVYDADGNNPSAWLANISTRGFVGTGENVLIPSVVVRGKIDVLVRAVGPGLAPFGVSNLLQNPKLTVYDGKQNQIDSNVGWKNGAYKDDLPALARFVGAFPLTDNDSALVLTLTEGSYTFLASGVGGTTGNALVEIYVLRF